MIDQIFRAFDGLKALNVFLIGVATVNLMNGQLLYEENFDSYNVGDAITEVSQAFDLWPAAGATDAFVSNDASWSGANSLKIEGQLTGGPMDVVLTAGFEGIQEFSFRLLVPPGASGYYNFQENIVSGTQWAFDCILNSDGTILYAVDPAAGSGGPELTTTYNYGSWIEIKHEIDTDADLMNILIDGECVGELPYDGEQIGGVNFYAVGDGMTLPLYYVDDISVTTLGVLPGCFLGPSGCTEFGAINFDPSVNFDDGSCDYGCSPDTDSESGAIHPFFSEYVEGWVNNKALEIFNPTSGVIDMTAYQLERYSNGANAAADNQQIQLMGLIEPLDVAVYTLDKQDPDGVGFESPVWDDLAAVTDHWLSPVYEQDNTMYYNGNDAMVLRHIASNQIVDVFGRVGEDPGEAGWAGMTQNHTLVRKASVAQGDTDPIDDFLVVDEWTGVLWSTDSTMSTTDFVFDNLGFHNFCFQTTGVTGGCTDPSAINFDPTADVDDGSCTYFEPSCAAIGAPEWEAFDLGLYAPAALLHTAGQSVTQEVVLHLPTSIEEAGTGTTYAVADWSGLEVMGMPAGLAFDNLIGSISGGGQTCLTYSGVPTTAGTYEVTLTGELFLSVFGNPVSAGMVEASLVITIEANGNAVFGCTYPHALNFNPVANADDGSCAFAGCTDPSAENFEPYASVDDGTCETEPCVASCLGDLNNDGSIGSADLLTLLTTFGGDCE